MQLHHRHSRRRAAVSALQRRSAWLAQRNAPLDSIMVVLYNGVIGVLDDGRMTPHGAMRAMVGDAIVSMICFHVETDTDAPVPGLKKRQFVCVGLVFAVILTAMLLS